MWQRTALIHYLSTLSSPMVVVTGVAGMGKSVLLRQLAECCHGEVSERLPEPERHAPGQDLFWDPGGDETQHRYQDAVRLLPRLKARRQRLYLTASWQVKPAWLAEGLVYQAISVVEPARLLFTLDELRQAGVTQPERCLQETGGWPVLVANYHRLAQPDFLRGWQAFVAARIVNLLPLRMQRVLVALALTPTLALRGLNVDRLLLSSLSPLVGCDSGEQLRLGNPHLAAALRTLAEETPSLWQGAMRLAAQDLWLRGERLQAIVSAARSNNIDLALGWFSDSGGGLYGHLYGFAELNAILDSFGENSVIQETPLAWAKLEALLKAGELMAARAFFEQGTLFHLGQPDGRRQALVRLCRLTLQSYLADSYADAAVQDMQRLAPQLVDQPLAYASLHNKLCLAHLTRGEWRQARVSCLTSLKHYRPIDTGYLSFFAHFHLCRLALHQGQSEEGWQQLRQAEQCLQQTPFRQSLTCEHAFIAMGRCHLYLTAGEIERAGEELRRVMLSLTSMEWWPEVMIDFCWHSMVTTWLRDGPDAAGDLLQTIRTHYGLCFPQADERWFELFDVFLLQAGGQWLTAQRALQALGAPAAAREARFHHWLRLRGEVALMAQRHSRQGLKEPEWQPEQGMSRGEALGQRLLQARFWALTRQEARARELLRDVLHQAERRALRLPLLLARDGLPELLNQLFGAEPAALLPWQQALQRARRQASIAPMPPGLTAKQWLVLQRLAEGLSNKQIANLSGISENTVKFHLKTLFRYFAVSKRSELLRAAQAQFAPTTQIQ